jgi:hypothetical protein
MFSPPLVQAAQHIAAAAVGGMRHYVRHHPTHGSVFLTPRLVLSLTVD